MWINVMFLSSVWILILTAPIHYRGSSDVMLHSSTSVPDELIKRIYILDGLRASTFSATIPSTD